MIGINQLRLALAQPRVAQPDRLASMRLPFLTLLLVAIAADASADCAPDKMVKVVFREATPGIDKNSFAAKPKAIWRLGSQYGRLEEQTDSENGIHGLTIVNGRDVWVVDLLQKTGRHSVDSASTSGFHAPMVAGEDIPGAVSEMEFGCEFQYMRAKAVKSEMVEIAGNKFRQYRATEGRFVLKLYAFPDRDIPFGFGVLKDGALLFYYQYMEYGTNLDIDPSMFARPGGITYTDG
jgi:hypothetical protein